MTRGLQNYQYFKRPNEKKIVLKLKNKEYPFLIKISKSQV